MGQKTGTSNTEKKVIKKATQKAFVMEYLKAPKGKAQPILVSITIQYVTET